MQNKQKNQKKMQYDPIKKTLGNVFNKSVITRKLFYRMLDILLLRSWHIKKELKKWAKQNSGKRQILDAGMGFGQYSYALSKINKQWEIKSVDIKEEQIADCKNFFEKAKIKNVNFEYADLTTYEAENSYDLIISVDVMEHIEEDRKVFENFAKSLKADGMLLISTPSDQGGSDVHEDHHDSFIDEHVRDGYAISDIEAKLITAGFSKVKSKYQYGKTGSFAWKLSMKYPILMLSKTKLAFILLPFYYILVMPFCLILNYIDVNTNHKTGTGLIVKAWK